MKAPLLTLNDGNMRPAVGIGTYQIRGGEGLSQLQAAIADGYRLIDSSTNYDNEGIVGKAIRRSGVLVLSFISPQNYQENIMDMMMH